jgi:hypothetical protein
MGFHKIIRYTNGRSRDMYGAQGWGKTQMNFLISIIEEPPLAWQESLGGSQPRLTTTFKLD